MPWCPLAAEGPAVPGSSGLWLTETSDLAASAADVRVALWSAESLPLCFPRNWPAVFKESAILKAFVNKSMLKGKRCRAVDRAAAAALAARETATARGVPLHPLHSFSNALALADALGWAVVKGYIVLESAAGVPGASFVALRHWWNVDATGAWLDLTPPLVPPGADSRVLLVETELGDKEPAKLTPARREFAIALATRLARGADDLAAGTSRAPGHTPVSAAAAATAVDVTDAANLALPNSPSKSAAPSGRVASAKASAAPGKVATNAATRAPGKPVDYRKWDQLDVSDEEEEKREARTLAAARQQAQLAQTQQAAQIEQNGEQTLNAAIDAAATASAMGNTEALDAMMLHAQQVPVTSAH